MRQTRGRIFAAADGSGLDVGGGGEGRGPKGLGISISIWEVYFRSYGQKGCQAFQ